MKREREDGQGGNDDDHQGEAIRFWERHYRARERRWSGNPNAVLVDIASSVSPGTALDLGCGEGADAIWLAALGWRVTAADVSATALGRAFAGAADAGVGSLVDFQQHDLARTFPPGRFDLVSAQYLHSPVEFPRDRVLQRAARAVAPGGLLLVVGHGSARPWGSNPDPHARFPTPDETLAAIELEPEWWDIEISAAPERQASGPGGQSATVVDVITAARRRSLARPVEARPDRSLRSHADADPVDGRTRGARGP